MSCPTFQVTISSKTLNVFQIISDTLQLCMFWWENTKNIGVGFLLHILQFSRNSHNFCCFNFCNICFLDGFNSAALSLWFWIKISVSRASSSTPNGFEYWEKFTIFKKKPQLSFFYQFRDAIPLRVYSWL